MLAVFDASREKDAILSGFHALSDPLRLKIITLLQQQELCVCDLCDRLEVGQSKLSFHLKVLREAYLIQSRQQGRWIYYSLNTAQLSVLEEFIAELRRDFLPLSAYECPPD